MRGQKVLDPIESYMLIYQTRRELLLWNSRHIIQRASTDTHRARERKSESLYRGRHWLHGNLTAGVADRLYYLSTREIRG